MAQHVVLYGVAIQQAIAGGDLANMKKVADEAQKHLQDWGDVRSALEVLKVEIARLEHKAKS